MAEMSNKSIFYKSGFISSQFHLHGISNSGLFNMKKKIALFLQYKLDCEGKSTGED